MLMGGFILMTIWAVVFTIALSFEVKNVKSLCINNKLCLYILCWQNDNYEKILNTIYSTRVGQFCGCLTDFFLLISS